MQRVLEMMLGALLETWRAVAPWLSDAVSTVPTWAWASLVTLGLVGIAVRMLRPTRVDAGAVPDLLFTRVELLADRPGSDRYAVDVGFSNLHHEPVQLLRIAVDGRSGRSVVRDVPAIVPARRAVDLESAVTLTPGGRGRLDLYAVVPSSPAKAWRIRVPLEWEPFLQRYSAVLLDQTVRAVRRLPRMSEVEARPSVDEHETHGTVGRPAGSRSSPNGAAIREATGAPTRATPGAPTPAMPGAPTPAPTGEAGHGTSGGSEGPVASVDQPSIAGLVVPPSARASVAADATPDTAPAAPSDDMHGTSPHEAEVASKRREDAESDVRGDPDGAAAAQPAKTPRLRFPDRF